MGRSHKPAPKLTKRQAQRIITLKRRAAEAEKALWDEVAAAYESGATTVEIGEATGLSSTTIKNRLAPLGIMRGHGRPSPVPSEVRAEAIRLLSVSPPISMWEIAERLDLGRWLRSPTASLSQWAHENGLPRRGNGLHPHTLMATKEEKDLACRLYLERPDLSVREIFALAGLEGRYASRVVIYAWLRARGIPAGNRPPRPPRS